MNRPLDETVAPTPQKGLMEDLVDIFARPGELFDRTRNSSAVRPALIQMLILGTLGIALHNLMSPFMDAEFARANAAQAAKMAESGIEVTEAQRAMGEKIATFTSYLGGFIGPWLVAFFAGIAVWLGAKIAGAKLRFGQGMMVASWSYMPIIIASVLTAVQGALVDPETVRGMSDASIGPARFFDPATTSPVVMALMQNLDLFSLWTVWLTAIGVSVAGRVSMGVGYVAAGIRFAIGVAFTVVPAMLRG